MSPTDANSASQPEPTRAAERHTILIVEDAPEFVQLVRAALERAGDYEIEVASDGVEAIERARSLDPDLVVLDLGLPGVDGIDVCLRAHAHWSRRRG